MAVAADSAYSLCRLLGIVRSGTAVTRPELIARSGLGRKLVTQRLGELLACGLLAEDGLAPSTGGRAPRRLRFGADAGRVLVAELGGDSVAVGLADLSGRLLAQRDERADVMAGPEGLLRRVEELFDALLADRDPGSPPVWGVGIGVLGPVDARSGSPLPLPPMPAWADYPIRKRFEGRYDVPVWVDNEVNLMALGEHRGGLGQGVDDLVFVKVGTGIGAGVITGGRLCRGARGSAGEVGHLHVTDDDSIVCWCGRAGCL
ncbi:ROK family protein, partial [Streptomyces sp. NPDC050211]|uniref:ROK family protein n=1 Tax=Streptomyces sp. NPDC050211 TaxID=3154932 RepID=UPI00342E6549